MPTSYSLPDDDDVLDTLVDVVRQWHQPLHDAGVKIDILFAASEDGEPLKRAGVKALARVRVEPLRNRIRNTGDALIEIDRAAWDALSAESRVAAIDHECSHLELVTLPDSTRPKRDDIGRPRLKLRNGDVDAGDGFAAVIERHGEAAVEAINYRKAWAFAKYHLPQSQPA